MYYNLIDYLMVGRCVKFIIKNSQKIISKFGAHRRPEPARSFWQSYSGAP